MLQREFAHQRVVELAGFCAVLEAMMGGRFDHAREQMALARAHVAELGLRSITMWMELFAAKAEMLLGDLEAAEGSIRNAERIALEIGDRWCLSTVLVDLAHILLAQDRLDDAEAAVARVETVLVPSDMEWLIKRHAARGKLAARQGRPEAGLVDALRAVEVADTTDLLVFRANAHGDLAEVLLAAGRRDEARRAAETSLRLHEAKQNAASARRGAPVPGGARVVGTGPVGDRPLRPAVDLAQELLDDLRVQLGLLEVGAVRGVLEDDHAGAGDPVAQGLGAGRA